MPFVLLGRFQSKEVGVLIRSHRALSRSSDCIEDATGNPPSRHQTSVLPISMKDIDVAPLCFYIAFACYCMAAYLKRTNIEDIVGISIDSFAFVLQIAALCLLAIRMTMQHIDLRALLTMLAVAGISLLSSRVSGSSAPLWLALFLFASQGVKMKTIAAVVFAVSSLVIVVTVAGALSGSIESFYLGRNGVLNVRSSLGFVHPNRFGAMVFVAMAAWLTLRFSKVGLLDVALAAVAAVIVVQAADSRTSAALIVFAPFVFIAAKKAGKTLRWRNCLWIALGVLFCCCFASVFLMVNYNPAVPWESGLNSILSGRLYYAHHYYVGYPPSLWGTDYSGAAVVHFGTSNNMSSTFVVDNAYARVILLYGIVFGSTLLAGFAALIWKARRDPFLSVCIVGLTLFMIAGLFEGVMLEVETNFFLLGLASIVHGFPVSDFDARPNEGEAYSKSNDSSHPCVSHGGSLRCVDGRIR